MPMAARLARTFAGRGEDLDDLTQVAMLALIKAASQFDSAREVPFAKYAYPCIVGGIKKHFRDTSWSLHITRRMQELHLQTNRAIPALTQVLRRTPTVADLAAHLRLSEQDIRDGLSGRLAYRTRSLNLPATVGEDCELAICSAALMPKWNRYPTGTPYVSMWPVFHCGSSKSCSCGLRTG
jgi:RNA polymerase sigma-B factor